MKQPRHAEAYEGREHSLIKHVILKAYLQRFFMIVGKHHRKIAYVDCFAGPWKSKTEQMEDSSAGIALKAMTDCRDMLRGMYPTNPRIRGLFIEADAEPAEKLESFIAERDRSSPPATVWRRNFVEAVDDIVAWLEPDEFAFVFVDPFGWKGLVTPTVLAPLLRRAKTELLINFMWNFINLATGHLRQRANLVAVFGEDFEEALQQGAGAAVKQVELMRRYRRQLTETAATGSAYRLRTALLPVEYFDRNAIIFFLVYATHNATGLLTFLQESEDTARKQAAWKVQHKIKQREQNTGQVDLFAGNVPPQPAPAAAAELGGLWLDRLPSIGSEVAVTQEVMADLAELGDCSLQDLQKALGQLIEEGRVANVSAKGKRRTHVVNWRNRERLVRLR